MAFLLGAIIVLIPCLLVITSRKDSPSPPSPPPDWNASDYISNSDYYQNLTDKHDFSQVDNLRLDRLSSPRLHPINGKSVIYLRQQYHMPDSNGSSATLHWLDLTTNKSIQLTRPIWGKYDQQVSQLRFKFVLNQIS